jgi:heat shock protein HtpX
MGTRQLYLGLWLRMAVALLLTVGGLLVLLATEFALAGVTGFFLLAVGPVFGVLVLGIGLFLGLLVGLYWLVSLWRGWADMSDLLAREADEKTVSDLLTREVGEEAGPDDPWQSLRNPPTVWRAGRVLGLFVCAGLGLALGYPLVFEVLEADALSVGVVGGTLGVVGFTGWVLYDEVRSGNSVRAELEAEHDIISDPEREHEVQRRVRRLAGQADSPAPDVEIGASHLPRAASVGYRPEESVILVSRGLVDSLDGTELDAVLAHELAHLLNRDAAVMTALAFPRSKIRGLSDLAVRVDDAALLLAPVFVAAIPVYIANRLAVPMVARYREYVADHAAGELVGSHAAMAGALTSLDREYSTQYTQDLRVGWSAGAFGIVPPPWEERKVLDGTIRFLYRRVLGTHPPTERRIERLRSRDL